jgi:phosphoribosyl 1,2-cyclic phosphate phosphodiesterase
MQHEFLLLGSGTSAGVPVPGCECAVCNSKDPLNWRNRTSALFTLSTGESLLIDATPDLRHQCLQHGVRRVDSVMFTHCHSDHICGTDELRAFNFKSGKAIDCLGTPETLAGIQSTFPYIFKHDPSYLGAPPARLNLREISNFESFCVAGVTFHPFPLPHGNVTVTGLRVGNIGYATDCKGLSPRAEEVLQGVDYLFLDGIRHEPHATHNSVEEAIEIARRVNAKQTYLIHITHALDHQQTSAALPQEIALGYDGLRVSFQA